MALDEQTLDILDNLDGCDAAVYDLERVIKGEPAEFRLEQYMIIEKFNVMTEDGEVINTTLELVTNGGFDYGNGHSLILTQEGINENIYDARYDRRFDNEESFRKYALEFVMEHVRDTCKVEKLENL